MEILRTNVFVSWVVSGRYDKEDIELLAHLKSANEVPPRLGFNWWYWIPKIETDFRHKKNACAVFEISWLCFNFEVMNYNRIYKKENK